MNKELLEDFVKYCETHPDQRFWQALKNWSEHDFIMIGDTEKTVKDFVIPPYIGSIRGCEVKDTYYLRTK